MKFIADSMLGKLAKWLRVLGHDVLYSAKLDDPELARIARLENRILLTRDTQLVKRRGVKFVLISSEHPEQQVRQLMEELGITVDADSFSRCLICNTVLTNVEAQTVAREVPPYVLATQTRFCRCPTCSRVYWRGTHWQRMQDKLRKISSQERPNA